MCAVRSRDQAPWMQMEQPMAGAGASVSCHIEPVALANHQHDRCRKLSVSDLIVRGLPRYLAGLPAFIDIRQIKSVIVEYPDWKRISSGPVNLASEDAD